MKEGGGEQGRGGRREAGKRREEGSREEEGGGRREEGRGGRREAGKRREESKTEGERVCTLAEGGVEGLCPVRRDDVAGGGGRGGVGVALNGIGSCSGVL